ncbi:TPA: hypothetical protein SIA39_004371, partial [Aeromonas sobria]|nr:hypothetical protein [Aeromonas sobria]
HRRVSHFEVEFATNCDHIEHIRTQFPYALVTGTIAFICYVILGFSI